MVYQNGAEKRTSTTPREVRLPAVHSGAINSSLSCFASTKARLGDLGESLCCTTMWNETTAVETELIERQTQSPEDSRQLILQGSHIYVGTPLSQFPNEICSSPHDFIDIDLKDCGSGYLPRTNYVPKASLPEYVRRIPKWKGRPLTDYYRLGNREWVQTHRQRTLVTCVIPPPLAHIYTIVGTAFESHKVLMLVAGLTASVPYDFFIKITGREHINENVLLSLPLPDSGSWRRELCFRALLLNCCGDMFAALWSELAPEFDRSIDLTNGDRRCPQISLPIDYDYDRWKRVASAFARRSLLIELDVLASFALGITLDNLVTIFGTQFETLQKLETSYLFDQHGRVVPRAKTVAGKPAVSLVELASTLKEQAGFDVQAEYHPDGSNTQELRKQKIRLGKKEADVLGVSERCTMADLLVETSVRWSDEDHPEGRPVRLVGLRYTDPGLEPRMERVYPTPWTRCDREADYRQAWAEFERRMGKKMPEGTPL